ncbi:MAG: (2Fe-2S) ferredoxin domain-containing protein [Xanthobacteraceae bacterium]|nr:(2Fe-2S) ferredoxin domain-containing protein [Xanthobacteraceae bacterium]
MNTKPHLTIARAKRPAPIFVCRKCLKRADDGRDIKRALKAGLKELAEERGERPPRVVMTDCFGLCPKRAVVTASEATLSRNEYVLLPDEDAAGEAVSLLTARKI